MRDKDTILLEQLVESKYDSLFSGKLEEDDGDTSLGSDDKDDDKDDKDDSDDNDSDDDKDSDDSDSDSNDNPFKKKNTDDEDEDEDEDEDDSSESKSDGGDAGIQSKVKQLQKQYNDLLVDAFEKYAAECIENALDGVESSFGEDIQDILDGALDELKGKILSDLGVDVSSDLPMIPGVDGDIDGGMEMEIGGEPEVTFGSPVGGVPTISSDDSEEDDEDEDEVEEEGCGMKMHGKKRKIVKESTKVADFYGFV